ncbi:hypothetical protein BJ165DRAFT_1409742 [Panaeolus papilionaceus]|nr:hypothetical protein BJ165DRAFT_1409742 [Panaeolus papilionaceus]
MQNDFSIQPQFVFERGSQLISGADETTIPQYGPSNLWMLPFKYQHKEVDSEHANPFQQTLTYNPPLNPTTWTMPPDQPWGDLEQIAGLNFSNVGVCAPISHDNNTENKIQDMNAQPVSELHEIRGFLQSVQSRLLAPESSTPGAPVMPNALGLYMESPTFDGEGGMKWIPIPAFVSGSSVKYGCIDDGSTSFDLDVTMEFCQDVVVTENSKRRDTKKPYSRRKSSRAKTSDSDSTSGSSSSTFRLATNQVAAPRFMG